MQGFLARLKSLQTENDGSSPSSKQEDGTNKVDPTTPVRNGFTHGGLENNGNKLPLLNGFGGGGNNADIPSAGDTPRANEAIDAVMASNRNTPRIKNLLSVSSPRPSVKSMRTKSSRISVNSDTYSDKDDFDMSLADSDEDELSTSRNQRMTPVQAWAAFENSVKSIDNSDPETFTKKPKPNFISSNTFQQVMMDMYGNTEYGNTKGYTLLKKKLNGMARGMNIASRMLTHAAQKGQEEREKQEQEQEEENGDNQDGGEAGGQDAATKGAARRGWKMVKRQVNESVMEQKTQSTKLNWTMLQHTVKQMSNVERTRQDLYERYGIVPTVQPDGTVICENRMLSDRARAQLYGNGADGQENRRPMSLPPSPAYVHSRTQMNFQKKTRDGAKIARLPSIGKHRPKTAIR